MKPIEMAVDVGLLETREDVERLIRRLCMDAAEPEYAAQTARRELLAKIQKARGKKGEKS